MCNDRDDYRSERIAQLEAEVQRLSEERDGLRMALEQALRRVTRPDGCIRQADALEVAATAGGLIG